MINKFVLIMWTYYTVSHNIRHSNIRLNVIVRTLRPDLPYIE